MENKKVVKGYCKKSKQHFYLELRQIGGTWMVVNFAHLEPKIAAAINTDIRTPLVTAENLLPCSKCGSRRVGGCNCAQKRGSCKQGIYNFQCVYCSNMQLDYTPPVLNGLKPGDEIDDGNVKIKVTFNSVKWTPFDLIKNHPSGAMFGEPSVHVVANEQNIEFHGYNISEMNEGVYYRKNPEWDFSIECDVDTSTIKPHPGGELYISLGAITASINQSGGSFYINDRKVTTVGSRFHMKLSVFKGQYTIVIDGKLQSAARAMSQVNADEIRFGFKHDSHYCELLSHAYLSNVSMFMGDLQY